MAPSRNIKNSLHHIVKQKKIDQMASPQGTANTQGTNTQGINTQGSNTQGTDTQGAANTNGLHTRGTADTKDSGPHAEVLPTVPPNQPNNSVTDMRLHMLRPPWLPE